MTELEHDSDSSESEEENVESSGIHAGPVVMDSDIDIDSDEELQEAFAAGLIKPGLNMVQEVKQRERTNNVPGLKQKLDEFKLDKMPWIERLDLINKPAPLAPELAYQEDQHQKSREKAIKHNKQGEKKKAGSTGEVDMSADPVHNDFKREMLFYRQAQAAALEGLARLKSMNIPTKRPDDYFAQMAKTDEHMQKIRSKLVTKQMTEEKLEKVRKLRDLRRFGKKVQTQVNLKRAADKKEMLDEVKKFRKGHTDTINFLEDGGGSGGGKNKKGGVKTGSQQKRTFKDTKFGFGGKKKGSKGNTKESMNDVSGFKPGFKKRGDDSGLGKSKSKGARVPSAGGKRLGKARRKAAKGVGGRGKKK